MKIRTSVQAGRADGDGEECPKLGCGSNHNETLRRGQPQARAGLQEAPAARDRSVGGSGGLRIRTRVQAGAREIGCPKWGCGENHSETLRRG